MAPPRTDPASNGNGQTRRASPAPPRETSAVQRGRPSAGQVTLPNRFGVRRAGRAARTRRTPIGGAPMTAPTLPDLYEWLERSRRDGQVHYDERQESWAVLGHPEAAAVLTDPATFSS